MKARALAIVVVLACVPRFAAGEVDLTRPLPADEHTICLLRFDDMSGGKVLDEATGKAIAAPGATQSLGRFGGAVSFDGVGGWIDVPDRPQTAPRDGITVECWVKFRNRASGDIICRNVGYMMRISGSLKAYFGIDGAWRTLSGASAIPVGRWTHLAMTYDPATKEARIYIDGKLDRAGVPRGVTQGQLDAGASVLRLGGNTWSTSGSVPDAKLDEFRVSSTVRTYRPLQPLSKEPLPENTNLVLNPSFESGMYGWRITSEGTAGRLWEIAHGDAAHGLAFLRARSPEARSIISYPLRIAPGKSHTISAAVRADRPCRVQLRLRCTGMGGGAPQPAVGDSLSVNRNWNRVSTHVAIPSDWPTDSAYVEIGVSDSARVDIDAVSVVVGDGAEYTQTDAQSIGLATQLPPHRTYMLNSGARLPLTITNTGSRARNLSIECVVTDWLGQEVLRRQLSVGHLMPGAAADRQTELFDGQVGWFVAHFTVRDGDRVVKRADRPYNVIEPLKGVGSALGSPIGMNTHMEREATEDLRRSMNILSLCGVKWIRAWWGWGMAEKKPGVFDWTEYDRQLSVVHGAGMEIMPILLRYYPPYEHDWAGKVDRIQQPPYDLGQWGKFVQTTARRYRGRVKAWEVWNEPNYTMEADYYAKLLKVTYESIRAADPDVTVVGFGGVSPEYIRKVFEAGSARFMDVIALHSYAELGRPFERMAKLAQAVEQCAREFGSTHRVWHTEQGSSGDGAGYLASAQTEEQVAINLVQSYLSALSTGAEKFFWFSAQTSPRYGMGIYFEDYVPRPRLVALNGLARVLDGRRIVGRLDLGQPGVACVLMDGSAGPAAALWNLADPMSIRLPQDVGAAWADMLGNPLPTAGDGEPVVLQLGRPVYVLANAPGLSALRDALRRAEVRAFPVVGVQLSRTADGAVRVELRNQAARRLDLRVSVKAPELFPQGVEPVGIADLAPRETRAVTFRPTRSPSAGTQVTAIVQVEVGDHGIRMLTGTRKLAF